MTHPYLRRMIEEEYYALGGQINGHTRKSLAFLLAERVAVRTLGEYIRLPTGPLDAVARPVAHQDPAPVDLRTVEQRLRDGMDWYEATYFGQQLPKDATLYDRWKSGEFKRG